MTNVMICGLVENYNFHNKNHKDISINDFTDLYDVIVVDREYFLEHIEFIKAWAIEGRKKTDSNEKFNTTMKMFGAKKDILVPTDVDNMTVYDSDGIPTSRKIKVRQKDGSIIVK